MPDWMAKIIGLIGEMLVGGDTTVRDNDVHISVKRDSKKLIVKNTGPGTVNVQQINIAAEHTDEVVKLLKERAFDKDIVFLQDDSRKILSSISELEKSDEVKTVINFFRGVIPDGDLIILRSGLYIKHLRSMGDPQGQKLKADIIARHGNRGKNIVNLVTAGYFESYIKPLYEQMSQQSGFTRDQFLKEYDIIVKDLPFAIFVNASMTADDVIREFNDKATRQLKYDVAEDVIALHGYGHNADAITQAKEKLGKKYDLAEESYFSGIKIVIVKVYYKTIRT